MRGGSEAGPAGTWGQECADTGFAGAQAYVAVVAVKDEVGEVFESLDGEAVRRAHAVAFAEREVGAPLGVGRLLPA